MSDLTPAAASATGELLWIKHPIGGDRPMAHVFMIADNGGIAWADHGWSDGLSGRHPFHKVLGPVQPVGTESWQLTPTEDHLVDDGPIEIRRPLWSFEEGTPDGDRARARELIEEWLAVGEDKLSLAPG